MKSITNEAVALPAVLRGPRENSRVALAVALRRAVRTKLGGRAMVTLRAAAQQ